MVAVGGCGGVPVTFPRQICVHQFDGPKQHLLVLVEELVEALQDVGMREALWRSSGRN